MESVLQKKLTILGRRMKISCFQEIKTKWAKIRECYWGQTLPSAAAAAKITERQAGAPFWLR